jgi:hypothetical protein
MTARHKAADVAHRSLKSYRDRIPTKPSLRHQVQTFVAASAMVIGIALMPLTTEAEAMTISTYSGGCGDGTCVYEASIKGFSDYEGGLLSIPAFDPALGVLTQAILGFQASTTTYYLLANPTANVLSFPASRGTLFTVSSPLAGPINPLGAGEVGPPFEVAPFSATFFQRTSCCNDVSFGRNIIFEDGDFSLLYGVGLVSLPVSVRESFETPPPQGLTVFSQTVSTLSMGVLLSYTPSGQVPAAGTLSLLLIGTLGLMASRKTGLFHMRSRSVA